MKSTLFTIAVTLALTSPTHAQVDWLRSPLNAHWYGLTPSQTPWTDAESLSASYGGHLATVRSLVEEDWLRQSFPGATQDAWIGFNDIAQEATWEWVSGETVTYVNWCPGEPSNGGGNENWGKFQCNGQGWNDGGPPAIAVGLMEVEGQDCNANGAPDLYDIATGFSADCNGNGVPDECETVNWSVGDDFDDGTAPQFDWSPTVALTQGAVQLTTTSANQHGWLWPKSTAPVEAHDLAVSFSFMMVQNGTGADGIWLMFYDGTCSGNIPTAGCEVFSVGLDTFANQWDPNGNHLELHYSGMELGTYTPSFALDDGTWHTLEVSIVNGSVSVLLISSSGTEEQAFQQVLFPDYSPTNWLVALHGTVGSGAGNEHWVDNVQVAPTIPQVADDDSDGVPDECNSVGSNYCTATANSSGFPASIAGWGSDSIVDNDVRFTTTEVAVNHWGYYLMSDAQAFIPGFGGSQGNLCLGPPILRFSKDVGFSGTQGIISLTLDLTNLPQGTVFQPGETWNFQLWFRDVNPNFTSNTSDGLAITFQ